ncbi:MAG: hypothetical protein D6791_17745, partial [Chloroflexi bacterium]
MNRRLLVRLGIVFVSILLLVLVGRNAMQREALAENRVAARGQPARARLNHSYQVEGAVVTQTFELRQGWTAIYLEVEPINDSPLVNKGTPDQPIMAPELSTIEAVFAHISCGDCLESVWTWNIPLTSVEYIVDPAEGLWDVPGWKHYFPEGSLGPDGEDRSFLSDLFDLHANTGYLIKLKDGTGPATLEVRGTPVVAHHQWLADSYHLAGFPVDPDAPAPPTVATFFQDLAGGPSPVSEVRALQADGTWSDPLAAGATLSYGEAYLVYYTSSDVTNYTAPFDVMSVIGEGLDFSPGFVGSKQEVQVQNLANGATTLQLQVLGTAQPAVALRYDSDPNATSDPLAELWPVPVTLNLGGGGATALNFVVPSTLQNGDGEALLALRAPDLGTRWLVPVRARAGSYAGLWIGDVVVNDVSESRLGGTNVENGELTIALHPRDLSGLQGAAQFVETVSGNTASVALTATLTLPAPEEILPLAPISAIAPYVAGYVFVDANQNGQRDGDEQGLAGVTVVLTDLQDSSQRTAMTDSQGLYLFEGLAYHMYQVSLDAEPAGYTADFPVTLPDGLETTNTTPQVFNMDQAGMSLLLPEEYRRQVLAPPYTLPQYDATGARVEPLLNFGMVRIYDVSLWTGQCSDRRERRRLLPPMLNGLLATTLNSAALNPQSFPVDDLLLGSPSYVLYIEKHGANNAPGQGIACGEIVVGAPTRFANGEGSEFRFRVLLRVDENGAVELLPDYATSDGKRV